MFLGFAHAHRPYSSQVDVKTPSYVLLTEPGSPPIQTVPLPIPLSSVRLVATFKTGRTITDDSGATVPEEVDKIVSRLVRLPISEKARIRAARRDGTATRRELELFEEDPDYEGTDLRPLDGRFVAGSNEVWGHWAFVDWPKEHKETVAEKRQKKEVKEHDCDTLRFEVEEHTWTPTLLRAPMPAGVIDELRNKYGQHRTRHDPQYQLAMEGRERRRAEYKAWAESTGGMLRTPARPKEGKKTVGSVGLRRKLLEQIGEVMAAKGIEMTKKREKETEKYLQRVKVKVVEDGGAGRMVGRAWDGDAIDREVEGETMSMPDANNSVLWRAADRAAEERRGESPSV